MRVILTVLVGLLLLLPSMAADKEPKYEPMNKTGLIQWYSTEVVALRIKDARYRHYLALMTLSQKISCFDVVISTKTIDRQSPFWHPTWSIDGTHCVDKRTYNCEGNNGK